MGRFERIQNSMTEDLVALGHGYLEILNTCPGHAVSAEKFSISRSILQ